MIVSQANPKVEVFNEDCIAGMAERLSPSSVHLTVTSIPFEELSQRPVTHSDGPHKLFTYSGKPEDVGNNGSTIDIRAGRFALNMRFVVDALYRVTAPGCLACIHIQQLLAYRNMHGYMGRRDFRGSMIDVFGAGGFRFTGEFVIQKNPQAVANRLNLHSLQFKSGYARNGCLLAPVFNDYVLIFARPGDHPCPPKPIFHATKNPNGWVTTEEWVRDAHGIWTDILEIDILDGHRGHKEEKTERHVCPLQLEVIRRLVRLYTNPISVQPDVTVLDPFGGIMSTPYIAIGGKSPVTKLGVEEPRNVVSFELKESYFQGGVNYLQRALASRERVSEPAPQPGLYDDVPADVDPIAEGL